MSRVLSARQSPIDPRRWILDLDCGHQAVVPSASKRPTAGRPRRKVHACEICLAATQARMERA